MFFPGNVYFHIIDFIPILDWYEKTFNEHENFAHWY